MIQLNESGLSKRSSWEMAGYSFPAFDRKKVIKNTAERPLWVHFGAGNIFRAFQANVVQKLLNNGIMDIGLVVAEGYDYEIIEKVNIPHDNYSILVTLKSDGSMEKTVVGSIVKSLTLDSENKADFSSLKEIFRKDSLQIASFTITEKGYRLNSGPKRQESYIGKVVSLLYERYLAGGKPIAMVSMDNCSHNGSRLSEAVSAYSEEWAALGYVQKGFVDYVSNPKKVSFPWSMIDKITPRPDSAVENILKKDGVQGMEPVVTQKNTYIAPFVNAEESEYLIIEDAFPNGRPPLEEGGIVFTSRQTVEQVERMKVCTCLNPLHTALAIFGCLLGYDLISEEMKDETLHKLVEGIGYNEGLPAVTDPGILAPKEFLDTVLNTRLPNPFMPDTPWRIATDTSQKLAVRFGETIKAYIASPDLDVSDLKLIPLVFAGWLRYLMAVDDDGRDFELSPDPLLPEISSCVSTIRLGAEVDPGKLLMPILKNEQIFGINLCEAGMADIVCSYFSQMITGPGAVKSTLHKYV